MVALKLSACNFILFVDELADSRLIGQEHSVLVVSHRDHLFQCRLRLLIDFASDKRLNKTVLSSDATSLITLSETNPGILLLLAPLFNELK